ncbi:MAG: RNA 2'-phosphotransferase [Candidatus Pacebacteria bacterium]|nr:RNA 2'-phosphotransferase [Candidatus Paceibacterota bacterium]
MKKINFKAPDPVPFISWSFQEGKIWDLWMIVHALSGAVSACVLAALGMHPMYAYPFVLLILTGWEIGEMVFGIAEELENWILDIVAGMLGFWFVYEKLLSDMSRPQIIAVGVVILLANSLFAFLGWRGYKKRNIKQEIRKQRYSQEGITFLLTNVLRHFPEDLGIVLDKEGWTDVDALVSEANKQGLMISREDIESEVLKNEKNRFSLSDDRKLIRANHGHTLAVDVGLQQIIPPDILYHRTNPEFVAPILKEGLRTKGRLYVHLSPSLEYLESYTEFGDDYVILKIDARAMVNDGYIFYASGDMVICTEKVPKEYISLES